MKFGLLALLAIIPTATWAQSGRAQQEFECGSHFVHVMNIQKGELSQVEVKFLNSDRKTVVQTIAGNGEVLSLCKAHEVLILDTNTQYVPGSSTLLTEEGKVLVRRVFGIVDAHGKSDDDKIFWIESKDVVEKKPIVRVEVYSFEGKRISTKQFELETSYSLSFEGKTYEIHVMKPDYPG